MIHFLFGSWPRRIMTLLVCGVAFLVSLTGALMVGVARLPASAEAVCRVPVLGNAAVSLAEWRYGPLSGPGEEPEEDVTKFRDLRPLSAEEIADLIGSLKDQRKLYVGKLDEMKRERKRLDLYRGELAAERDQIVRLREQVVAQWEEVNKAREGLEREVTELDDLEASNLKHLATTYESMKPERAALVVEKLDEETAVKTIFLMRERSAAKILEQLDHEKAARLTELMRLLKRTN